MTTASLGRLGTLAAALAAGPALAQYAPAALPAGLTDVGFMAAPALVDVDADGDLDLFAGRSDGAVAFFENTGSATAPAFAARTGAANPLDGLVVGFAVGPRFGDLDADGDADLLLGNGPGFGVARRNDGSAAAPAFGTSFPGLAGPTGGPNSLLAVGDVDGDGDLDAVRGAMDGTLAYFENTGSRTAPALTLRTGAANPLAGVDVGFSSAPTLLDLDGDGDLDLVVGNVDGVLQVALRTGGPGGPLAFGALADAATYGLADIGYGAVPAAGDLDGDGDLDVLVGASDGTFVYYRNDAPALQVVLAGPEGYRELASPVPGALLSELLGPIHTQGMPGSDYPPTLPNVFQYDETVPGGRGLGYAAPATLAAPSGAGQGVVAYVYEDDDPGTPGTQGGFPKTLAVAPGPLVTQPFTWGGAGAGVMTYTDSGSPADDGWNLLGNPFAGWLDWDATAATGMDAAVYVFDGPAAQYLAYSRGVGGTLPGGVVGAFTAFWVHATAAGPTLTADPSPSSGGPVYGRDAPGPRVALRLAPEAGGPLPDALQSSALLALGVGDALDGVSPLDARALVPPAAAYVLVGTRADDAGGPATLAVDARPLPGARAEIDLDVRAAGVDGDVALALTWPRLEHVPDDWTVALVDRATGVETDLRSADRYAFTLGAARREALPPGPTAARAEGASRFALVVTPGRGVAAAAQPPAALALSAPRPNPAADGAWLDLDLPAQARADVRVLDVLGRTVAVLLDGERAAGRHALRLPAGLAPGVYTVRAAVDGGGERRVLVQQAVVIR